MGGEGLKAETRSYKTFSSSLTELKEWLIENGVTHVAMESTGVYWKPVYKVLECPELTVWIVNARHIKYVPGHKTDKKDSAWICKLLLAGLLKPSYIPPREQRQLRDLTRYRTKLVQQIASEKNRIIRILEVCNVKLDSEVPGLNTKTVEDLIAEIGLDMSQFPSEKHIASWVGIWPGNNESAGKKKLTHQPRKQARQSSPDRSRLGGHPYKRYILQRALPHTGIPQRQEAGIVGDRTFDPEVSLLCAQDECILQGTWC